MSSVKIPAPLSVNYDEATDTLTVDKRKYSGSYFRFFAPQGAEVGKLFEIKENNDERVTIGQFHFEGLLRFIVTNWLKK